mmetsp:Transcript_7356/g.23169  ORF Transcript_7356/g.23169 Transcript_7356/m.23169 type:complete len:108 (+) Transcript_7356:1-324(+)
MAATMADARASARAGAGRDADSMATPSMLRRFEGSDGPRRPAAAPPPAFANFKMLKRGARGKLEARDLLVPEAASFAASVKQNKEARDAEDRALKEKTGYLASRQEI